MAPGCNVVNCIADVDPVGHPCCQVRPLVGAAVGIHHQVPLPMIVCNKQSMQFVLLQQASKDNRAMHSVAYLLATGSHELPCSKRSCCLSMRSDLLPTLHIVDAEQWPQRHCLAVQ